MEKRGEKKGVLLGVLVVLIGIDFFFYKGYSDNLYQTPFGKAIGELFGYGGLNPDLILLLVFSFFTLIMVFFVASVFREERQEKISKKEKTPSKKEEDKRASTPLDEIYSLLVAGETLTINDIAKKFHVSKDQATNWVRILEKSHLVEFEYGLLASAKVKIKEKVLEDSEGANLEEGKEEDAKLKKEDKSDLISEPAKSKEKKVKRFSSLKRITKQLIGKTKKPKHLGEEDKIKPKEKEIPVNKKLIKLQGKIHKAYVKARTK